MSTFEDSRPDATVSTSSRLASRLAATQLRRWLGRVEAGSITVRLPDGTTLDAAGPAAGPAAQVNVRSWKFVWRIMSSGLLGLGSSWRDAHWDSPDLGAVLDFGILNEKALSGIVDASGLVQKFANLRHQWNANTRRGSRKNIAFHYDLGNAFYSQWLDPTMTYSAALFSAPEQSLEAAQIAKYRRITDELQITASDSILEIGCGWGGFAEFAARETGCRVVGLTLSQEQADWARDRVRTAGMSDRVEIRLQDYRDCSGTFDKIVSIEMFEAVGEANWPTYFETLRGLLKPDGAAMVQVITIDEAVFPIYRKTADFIQTYIFPGGMLPSPERFASAALAAGLDVDSPLRFGRDYERTLLEWDRAFHDNWKTIAPLGFDWQFFRLWRFYLHYCASGFRNGRIDVVQFCLRPTSPCGVASAA